MIPTNELFTQLHNDDPVLAEQATEALIAHANALWPSIREAVLASSQSSSEATPGLFRLQRVFAALPAPLDEPLLVVATAKAWSAQLFEDALWFDRADDVVDAALRFIQADDEAVREVGVSLLHRAIPRVGPHRSQDVEPEIKLGPSTAATLHDALQRGVDPYVVAQLLVRRGWFVEEALVALRVGVEEELERDAHDGPGEDIGYDLGCDLQNVANTLMHAGDAAQAHVALLDRFYQGGDAALRSAALESIVGIGGDASRDLVQRWAHDYPPFAKRLQANSPSYEVGFRLRLEGALALLEPRPATEITAALLPLADSGFFAEHAFHQLLPRLVALDPRGVTALLRERSHGEGDLSGVAARCLSVLEPDQPKQ